MLTQQQENFCLDILREVPQGQAYMNHYNVKSMDVADACASKLLRNPKIETRIEILREKAISDSIATVIERKQVLTEIIRGRFSDFENIEKLDKGDLKSAALHEVKVIDFQGGPEGRAKQRTVTIKLRDPISAIETLNSMEGIGKEPEGQKQTNNYVTQVNIYNNGHDAKKPFKEIIEGEIIRGNGNKRENT